MIAPTAEDGKGFADTKIIMADIQIDVDKCGRPPHLTETLEKSQ